MRFTLLCSLMLLCFELLAQKEKNKLFSPSQKYPADSLIVWTRELMTELSLKHPGFYRYTTKASFDSAIDSALQTITDSLTTLEYYRKLKPLIGLIRCVHTSITLPSEYDKLFNSSPSLIPFEVFIDHDQKAYITRNHSTTNSIPVKAELLSINGRRTADIIQQLYNAIPTDGVNTTLKPLILSHQFGQWYQSIIESANEFNVEIRSDNKVNTYIVKASTQDQFPTMEKLESADKKQLDLKIQNQTAILTVHSFAKSVMKKNGQHYKKFIRDTFKTLAENRIETLIIDLRYNTGGTDGYAALLASYFFDKPFRYWEKIEVTAGIANEIKGTSKIFYRKPIRRDSTYQWRKTWFSKEFDYYETQYPARNSFSGSTFLLTNGLCLSSCADFVAILSYNKKAVVVGQETGGGFQGNNSGLMPKTTIPTGLIVTVPLLKYTNAVGRPDQLGGTVPDYPVTPNLTDWINEGDAVMEQVLKLSGKE